MNSNAHHQALRYVFAAVIGMVALTGCAPDDAQEEPVSEHEEALQRADVASTTATDVASTKAASSTLAKSGFVLGKTYSVDDAGVIASASGGKLALPPTDLHGAEAQSSQRLIGVGGGTTLGGGGLNAWGCWTGSCCVSGHYEAGPVGWVWVCDAYRDCDYCLWPY